jgi:hypothetical protein
MITKRKNDTKLELETLHFNNYITKKKKYDIKTIGRSIEDDQQLHYTKKVALYFEHIKI